jgi:hypothetical protein
MDKADLEKIFDEMLAEMRKNRILSISIIYRMNYFVYRTVFLLLVLFICKSNPLKYLNESEKFLYLVFVIGIFTFFVNEVFGILICVGAWWFNSLGLTVRNEEVRQGN